MPGICLIFNKETKDKINGIYQQINEKLKQEVLKIDENLEPHITLLHHSLGKDFKVNPEITNKIDEMVEIYQKKIKEVNGFGIFKRGERHILYLCVSYDIDMQTIHKQLWEELSHLNWTREHYHYSSFIPHITIPILNQDMNTAMQVLTELLQSNISETTLIVDQLAYLTANYDTPKVYYKKDFNYK